MSLRYVHILFITLSILLVAGFAIWGVRDYRMTGDMLSLMMAIVSAILILPILVYGRWFWNKSRKILQSLVAIGWLPVSALLYAGRVEACSVCAVDPDSLMARGAFWGILSLGLVVAALLAAIAVVGFYWMHRARQLKTHI